MHKLEATEVYYLSLAKLISPKAIGSANLLGTNLVRPRNRFGRLIGSAVLISPLVLRLVALLVLLVEDGPVFGHELWATKSLTRPKRWGLTSWELFTCLAELNKVRSSSYFFTASTFQTKGMNRPGYHVWQCTGVLKIEPINAGILALQKKSLGIRAGESQASCLSQSQQVRVIWTDLPETGNQRKLDNLLDPLMLIDRDRLSSVTNSR